MPQLHAFRVAMLNRSTVLSDDEAHAIARAVCKQANTDFVRVWGIDARCNFVPSGQLTGWEGKWNLVFLDTSDEANALGYHDLTPDGLPLGKVFAKTTQLYGGKVSVTASHELLEMLLDPYINDASQDPHRNIWVAKEACDAVEADELSYQIDGISVSDFVTPEFFDPTAAQRKGERFSFLGHVKKPFELAPGGYEAVWVPGTGWTQYFKRGALAPTQERAAVGSRRERRFTPTGDWQRSPA